MASDIEAYLRGEAAQQPPRWNWNGEHLLITVDVPIIDATGRQNYEIHSVMLDADDACALRDSLVEWMGDH